MSKQSPQPKGADLVLDTNVLIQCKTLDQLPWQKVRPDVAEFSLLLTRVVTGQLDKLKTDVNRRREERARKAGKLIDRLLESTAGEIVISENGPRVVLRIAERAKIVWGNYPELDREHSDDRMVAEAMALRKSGREMILVSQDAGPRISAKQEGLAAFKVPDDWLLPPQSDGRDKEIQKLRAELELLREQGPLLEVQLATADGDPLGEIELSPDVVPGFTDAALDALVAETQVRYPMATFGQESPKPKNKKGGSGQVSIPKIGFG